MENKNGKIKVSIPCPDGIKGCAVAHYKWLDANEFAEFQKNKDLEDLITTLRYSMQSKIMLDYVSVAMVRVGDEYIILKNREDTVEIDFDSFIEHNDVDCDFKELIRKNVIFGHDVFGIRGKHAIKRWLNKYGK